MKTQDFFHELDARIAKYDLLCHPFYIAWSAGELSREDLLEYGEDYYHHVNAFPTYLAVLAIRLEECELRKAVLANMADEEGLADGSSQPQRAHAKLWGDFVEGIAPPRQLRKHVPHPAVKALIDFFHAQARDGTVEEALAAFYAYESQVPRIASAKAQGLKEMYGADEKTCRYFTLHATADVFHAKVWRQQLCKRLKKNPQIAEKTLNAAENTARMLWLALDGIEERRNSFEVCNR